MVLSVCSSPLVFFFFFFKSPSKVFHCFGLREAQIATTTFSRDIVIVADLPAIGYAQVDA